MPAKPGSVPDLHRAACTLGAALLAAAGLAACGVLDPVPAESSTTRLWQPARHDGDKGSDKPTEGGAGAAAASAVDCSKDDGFVGGLGSAVCEADQRRLAYLGRSAAVVNGVANYNAMLWPLGAAAVHEKLRGAPNSKLILPAVLAAAGYGFIKSGIPEREKIYLEAARQLGCAIVGAAPDLYRWNEVDPQKVAVPHQAPHALRPALDQLALHIKGYDAARADLLADLQPRPGKPAVAAAKRSNNVFERWTAPGGNGGKAAVAGKDTRPDVFAETRARLVHARTQLAAGHAVLRRLDSGAAATALRARIAVIDATVHKQLAEQAPPPVSPVTAAAEFKAALVAQASADAAAPAAAAPDPLETALPHTVYDGLDARSADALRMFQKRQAAALRNQVQTVSDWLARHATARDEVQQTLLASGCTNKAEDDLKDATKIVLDTMTRRNAERAKTSNTGTTPSTTTTTDPASGSTLPKTTP